MTYGTGILATNSTSFNQNFNIDSVENKFASQDEFYRTPNGNKLDKLTTKILKISTTHQKGIHPRRFCRGWFGLLAINNGRPRFTEDQILAMESEHGYREKCINLIARLLKIKPNTVHRWGKGVAFNKIPADKREKYEIYLGYVDAIRVITLSLNKLDEASLLKLLRQLEKRD